ncbi:SGNH hydrolase domain-containing protein [Polaromonas sp. LjRoot131]|uniref:SGNH hydrolase domain-containing protein n=1 Tax=Polaromonas sp. LjRoot131 TaxID=3342262 RepID=UPI003F502C8A
MEPSPANELGIPECLFRARRLDLSLDTCSRPKAPIEAQRQETLAALKPLAASAPDIRVIDAFEVFCGRVLCKPYAPARL